LRRPEVRKPARVAFLKVFLSVIVPEELVPDVEVAPVDEVEDAEEDGGEDEEETVDLGVLETI
jgi:hypothetical protein